MPRIIAEISSGVWKGEKEMRDSHGNVGTMKAHKIAILAAILDLHAGFAILLNDFERPTTPNVKQTKQPDKNKPTNA